MATWQPLGKLVLVRLHKTGSALQLDTSDINYNGLATVLDIGPEVAAPVAVGDVVMLNGPQTIIAHKELGEDIALCPSPVLLARRVEEEVQH